MKIKKAYGLWKSVFTPELLSSAVSLSEPCWDRKGEHLLWLEERDGRGTIMVSDASQNCPRELTMEQNVRARVGYGGGNFCVGDGVVVFVGNEGKLYRQSLKTGFCVALTPGFGQCAAPQISPDGQWIAFASKRSGNWDIYVSPTNSPAEVRRVTDLPGQEWDPAWHPSGAILAFASRQTEETQILGTCFSPRR